MCDYANPSADFSAEEFRFKYTSLPYAKALYPKISPPTPDITASELINLAV